MAEGRGKVAAAAAICFALALPTFAGAQGGYDTDPTRKQWAAEADSLCQESNKKALPLARDFARADRQGKARLAGRKLIALARHLIRLVEDIAAISRPPADATRIENFVETALKANRIGIRAGRAYVDRKVNRGNRIYRKSAKLSPKLEKLARPFDIKHCI